MKKKILAQRTEAVKRYCAGESLQSICASLGKTKPWLYKWVARYSSDNPSWSDDQSRRPFSNPHRTSAEIEKIIAMVRMNLYHKGLFCGSQAILWELQDMEVHPLPSLSTIGRILQRRQLKHRRTGRYSPKGKKYPVLPAVSPNQTHQVDVVGPCYLAGPLRFYSLHAVDVAINRCGIEPIPCRGAQSILDAVYALWLRMGIPDNLQVDNEMAFYGSPTHPRGMGPLIRLCLLYGVNLWFIPPAEPWRNGIVEKFNHHYQQKLLDRVTMRSIQKLREESLAFEHRHNSTYRYSTLQGKTPLKALEKTNKQVVFPRQNDPPRHPLEKPVHGCYHLVRFIRSNCRLNIFGEIFLVPPETQYEYVVATIDVKEQKLKLYLHTIQIEEYKYQLCD